MLTKGTDKMVRHQWFRSEQLLMILKRAKSLEWRGIPTIITVVGGWVPEVLKVAAHEVESLCILYILHLSK